MNGAKLCVPYSSINTLATANAKSVYDKESSILIIAESIPFANASEFLDSLI